jgi:hypothetical protein
MGICLGRGGFQLLKSKLFLQLAQCFSPQRHITIMENHAMVQSKVLEILEYHTPNELLVVQCNVYIFSLQLVT